MYPGQHGHQNSGPQHNMRGHQNSYTQNMMYAHHQQGGRGRSGVPNVSHAFGSQQEMAKLSRAQSHGHYQHQSAGTHMNQTHRQMPPNQTDLHRSKSMPNPHDQREQHDRKLFQLVLALTSREKREQALLSLSKKREHFQNLAPILWHSVGTIAALLQEIMSIYPLLHNPSALTAAASNRCCNALALLQCVASHQETRSSFLNAHIPLFLYPFLNTTHTHRPFEYLRLTSLGVIGALVKMDDPEVITFLLQTEIIPLCLRIMENGSELSKTVATFIVQKILLDDSGLTYMCATPERFYTVSGVFANMVSVLVKNPSIRLLKHIIRCYFRLSDNSRAREALAQCLPSALRDGNVFDELLKNDHNTRRWLEDLRQVIVPLGRGAMQGLGGPGAARPPSSHSMHSGLSGFT